jgi:energy-coupling factor transport system substrate-specific component
MSTTNTPKTNTQNADVENGKTENSKPENRVAASTDAGTRRRSIRASTPLWGWRTVDLLTIAFLGAAFGIAYWGWDTAYAAPSNAISAGFAPLAGLLTGPWFMAGIVGGLVVRRPGAAFFCEVVAALVSMVPGTQWGFSTLLAGIFQGAGAEIAFAVLGYGVFGIIAAMLAGALSAPIEIVYEWFVYYADWSLGYKLAYLLITMVSGVVVAGAGGWVVTRALARAGALNAFPPGQEAREARAV